MLRHPRDIDTLVIHCADTPDGSARYGLDDVDLWHAARGFRRDDEAIAVHQAAYPSVGYHWVVPVDGRLVPGRAEVEVGAHAEGINGRSVGICLMGRTRFTLAQWTALAEFTMGFVRRYPGARTIGHREHEPAKTCPGFDVQAWRATGLLVPEAHLFT